MDLMPRIFQFLLVILLSAGLVSNAWASCGQNAHHFNSQQPVLISHSHHNLPHSGTVSFSQHQKPCLNCCGIPYRDKTPEEPTPSAFQHKISNDDFCLAAGIDPLDEPPKI